MRADDEIGLGRGGLIVAIGISSDIRNLATRRTVAIDAARMAARDEFVNLDWI